MHCWTVYLVSLALTVASSWGKENTQIFRLGETLEPSETPMGIYTLDPKIQSVLKNYFTNSFGGMESWDQLNSLIIRGKLKLPQGNTFEFTNYRKKPDLNKTVVSLPRENSITKSFDGKEAWQHHTFETDEPVQMPLANAIDFVRDSIFGSHLLYPQLPGKEISYLGEQRIGNHDCYQLGITLPNKQYMTMSIDKETGLQVQQEQISSIDGRLHRYIQSDYRKVAGTNIPFKVKVYSDDKLLNETMLASVEANRGVMPWVFQRH